MISDIIFQQTSAVRGICSSKSFYVPRFDQTKSSLEIADNKWVRGANGDIYPSKIGRSDNGEALLIDGVHPSPPPAVIYHG